MSKPVGIILLEDEPTERVLSKLLAWVVLIVIFVLAILYSTEYFLQRQCYDETYQFETYETPDENIENYLARYVRSGY